MDILNTNKRTNFMLGCVVNDIPEIDILASNWDLFTLYNDITYDIIRIGDLQRPDKLSYRLYNDVSYWWVVCKVNRIDDVWNDMYIGMDIIVPSVTDILTFYRSVKARVRS